MPESERILLKALEKALENQNQKAVVSTFEELHPADAADFFNKLEEEALAFFLQALNNNQIVKLFEHLRGSDLEQGMEQLPVSVQRIVLEKLPDDVRVDLLQEFDPKNQQKLLSLLSPPEKKVTSELLEFPEHTAGGRMTTSFASVRAGMTIEEAIEALHDKRDETEILSRIYVVDTQNRILGKLRLRDLTFHKRSSLITDIMNDEIISINASADQEEAAKMMSKYDLFVLPVIDEGEHLLGIITYDDAMEILEEETTEDLEKSSAITPADTDETYLKTAIWTHIRRRFPWIFCLSGVAVISGCVIYHYEKVLNAYFVLAIYMPMVIAAGGNTGGQAAMMVIRSMSLGELKPSSFLSVAWKELRVGFFMGMLLALAVGIQIYYFRPAAFFIPEGVSAIYLALTVSLSLVAQLSTSTFIGSMLPILAKTVRLDPAVLASPAITAVADISGLVIYFSVAKSLLGI